MGLVTVVEAAGLSGLDPDEIRSLILAGRLEAREVALTGNSTFLIDETSLQTWLETCSPKQSAPCPDAQRRLTPLEQALADLQSALQRRRPDASMAAPGPAWTVARRALAEDARSATGLSQAELTQLAARMDRLLEPGPAGSVDAAPTRAVPAQSWWRRLFARSRVPSAAAL